MRFSKIRLQDFRNIPFAELDLAGDRTFLLGPNAQGKSNLLEALGLATALRSFRTSSTAALTRKGATEFVLLFEIDGSEDLSVTVEVRFSRHGRSVRIDGEEISRLGDFIGRFPTVVLSSGDLMLLRGGPAERRRFVDLTLSACDGNYYRALRAYHLGVAERNRLLKNGGGDAECRAFEHEMAVHAAEIVALRARLLEKLSVHAKRAYADLAGEEESPELNYRPSVAGESADVFLEDFEASRERDRIIGSTQKGPHRDDLALSLRVGGAREFASDGQQRGLCLALRLGQAALYREILEKAPVLLIDDVIGELDPEREAGFWRACPAEHQVIATGTTPPSNAQVWNVWDVFEGAFTPQRRPS